MAHTQKSNVKNNYEVKDNHVLHISGQESSMSSMSLMMMGWFLYISNHARNMKFGTQVLNHIYITFEMSRMTPVLHVFSQELSKPLMMMGRFFTDF